MSPTFAELGVPDSICDALARRDITKPFDIQAATLVDALAGRDVLGRAPTGSGKTLAFGIPVVAGLGKAEPRRPLALILSPTRELAAQIHSELSSFSKPVRIGVVYGGVGYGKQVSALRQGIEVLVACPGRLEDLIERGDVELDAVERVVLDEADRMADMGFMPAVRRILDQTRDDRQTVLFSATLDGDVAKLTREYQYDPVRHEVGESTPDITVADHVFWKLEQPDRTAVTALVTTAEWPAIVFCRTRHGCDRLAKQLKKQGVDAVAIHGGRSQNQRTRALDDFTSSRAQALIATDVAARGIHVDGVALVVHFDPPEDHKAYVHRSGRTARAGAGGIVVSLLTSAQTKDARKMMRKLDLDEPITDPDVEIVRALSAGEPKPERPAAREDAPSGRNNGGGGRGGGGRNRGGGGRNQRKNSKPKNQRRKNSNQNSDGNQSGNKQSGNQSKSSRNGSSNGSGRSGSGNGSGRNGSGRNGSGNGSGAKRSHQKSSSNRGGNGGSSSSRGGGNGGQRSQRQRSSTR